MLVNEQFVNRGRVKETFEPSVLGALVRWRDGGTVDCILRQIRPQGIQQEAEGESTYE